jgi:protein arginine N-methyltransferase 1
MYDILDHGRMIADRTRTSAYARAIAATVRPDSVVVDLGTGSGLFALLACRAGAKRVYAIESSAVIEVARELAEANGFSDRITFLHADSRGVSLPERANVLIADIHGVLPLFGTALQTMLDARERFLVPGAAIIPRVETLVVALVESPRAYAVHAGAWSDDYGVDLGAAKRLALNHSRKAAITPAELLSEPREWARIDYARFASTDCSGSVELTTTRDGIAHGFAMWFDAELAEGIGFSNAPDAPETIFGRAFYPFEEPIPLAAGEALTLDLAARLVNDDDYLWRWTARRGGRTLLRQSSFFAYPQRFGAAPAIVEPLDDAAVDDLAARALDETYWRSLRPEGPRVEAELDAAPAVAALEQHGWFAIDGAIPRELATSMLEAVERVRAAGWPPVFAFAYEEFWSLFRTPAIRALAATAIGDDAAQTAYFWTHIVGDAGWAPHADAASDDEPPRLNLWLPLRDATLDNGCMTVVPRDRAPRVDINRAPSFDRETTMALLQSARAVPAPAGALLGWDFRTIHWGSARHDADAPPRVSIAIELCSAAAMRERGEEAIALDAVPDLRARLRLIAGAMATYARREPDLARFEGLRARLARV